MEISDEQHKRIIAYLDDLMPLEEQTAFISELNSDEGMQRSFDLELLLRDAGLPVSVNLENNTNNTDFEAATQHLAKVNLVMNQQKRPVVKGNFRQFKSIAAAAAILIVLTTGYIFIKNKTNNTISKVDTLKKAPEKIDSLPLLAFNEGYYRHKPDESEPGNVGKYADAYYYDKAYSFVVNAKPSDYTTKGEAIATTDFFVGLYQGLSYIELKQPQKAILILKNIMSQAPNTSEVFALVRWNLAMAYLENADIVNAKVLLKTISADSDNSFFQQRANKVLQLLH